MSQKPKPASQNRMAPVRKEPEDKVVPVVAAAEVEPAVSEPIAAAVLETIETVVTEIEPAPAETLEAITEEVPPLKAEPVACIDTVAVEVAIPAPSVKSTATTPLQGMKTMMKTTEEFVAFGQANMEAFMKSSQIWAAGVQELTKQFTTTAKASLEESVTTFKAISTAKSVKEAIDLQSSFAKTAFEKAVAESKQLTDASIKLTEQALAPITARVTVAVEKFAKAA